MVATKWYNYTLDVLSFLSVLISVLGLFGYVDTETLFYKSQDIALSLIFLADFFMRLKQSPSKPLFLRKNWLLALSTIPCVGFPNVSRIPRVLRLMKITGLLFRVFPNFAKFIKSKGFCYLVVVTLSLLLGSAGLYSYFEHIGFESSLWWSVATMTTVGYGDISPTTEAGKVLATILMFSGIGIVGSLTSTITTFITIDGENTELAEVNEKLDKILFLLEEKS